MGAHAGDRIFEIRLLSDERHLLREIRPIHSAETNRRGRTHAGRRRKSDRCERRQKNEAGTFHGFWKDFVD
jgi:hypothetical protein